MMYNKMELGSVSTLVLEGNSDILFANDSFEEAYGEEYKSQIRRLNWHITEGETGAGQFVVLDIEAGLGKSQKTDQILKMYMDDWGERTFLIVKRFKEDVYECVASFKDSGIGKNAALGITSDNWGKWEHKLHELHKYNVLVITHERYKKLCLDDTLRSYFTNCKHTLIIDEKMDFPIYTFNEIKYNEVFRHIPRQLHRLYIDVCEPLFLEIDKMGFIEGINLKVVKCKPQVDSKLLASFIEKLTENKKHISSNHIQEVFDFVDVIMNCYNNTCFFNGGRISCFNSNHHLWGLKNNIILDANGSLDHSYNASPRISIEKFPKLLDHSDSTIVWVNFNSGRSFIEKNINEYCEVIAQCISALYEDGDSTLVVTHNKHEKTMVDTLGKIGMTTVGSKNSFNGEQVVVNHFGNLLGKNDYRDFEVCWIVGTPNIPLEAHVLKWYQYGEKKIRKECYTIAKRDNALRFDDNEIDKMRVGHIAGEMYQCLKRVQRVCHPKGVFIVVTKTKDVFQQVASQMLGIKINDNPETNTLQLSSLFEKYGEQERKKPDTKGAILKSYILSIEPGEYTKKQMREAVNFTEATFTRVLRDSIELEELVKMGVITIHSKKIVRHPVTSSYIA